MASQRALVLLLNYILIIFLPSFATGIGFRYVNTNENKVRCPKGAIALSYVCVEPRMRLWQNLPPIVLLHGILDSKKTWMLIAPKLAEFTGRKVYALDMRNHGESHWSDEFNLDTLSDDLDCFLQQHHIQKAVFIGHSLGAKTMMFHILRKPERVEKVVFEDMQLKNLEIEQWQAVGQGLQTIRKVQRLVPNNVDEMTAMNTFGSAIIAAIAPEESQNLSPNRAAQVMSTLPIERTRNGNYVWQANLDVLEKAIMTPGHLDQCLIKGQYYGDALFIYGTNSFINVPSDTTIKKHFPYAQFTAVEGSSHLVHQFHPEEFLMKVVKFINSPSLADVQQQVQIQF